MSATLHTAPFQYIHHTQQTTNWAKIMSQRKINNTRQKKESWPVWDKKKSVKKTQKNKRIMSEVLRCSFQAGRWAGWSLLRGHRKCASSLRWKCPRRWRRSPPLRKPASAGRSGGRSGTGTGRTSPYSGDLAGCDGAASLQDGQTQCSERQKILRMDDDGSQQQGNSTNRSDLGLRS